MIINTIRYCDVCGKRIGDFESGSYVYFDGKETIERHYCSDHMFMGEKFQKLTCGASDDIFESNCKTDTKTHSSFKETSKEITNLEVYDTLSELFEKYFNYSIDCFGHNLGMDNDFIEYYKNTLSADIKYNRLKIKGKIKEEKEETEC